MIKINKAENINKERKIKKEEILFFVKPVLCCLGGSVFGMSGFNGINPIGIAYCWAFAGRGFLFYPICLFSFLGYILSGYENVAQYLLALFLTVVLGFILENRKILYNEFNKAIIAGLCMVIGGGLYYFISGTEEYIIIKIIVESAFCSVLTAVFGRALKALSIKESVDNDLKIIYSIIISIFIASFYSIVLYKFNITIIMSILAVLCVGMYFSYLSTNFGIILGVILLLHTKYDLALFAVVCILSLMCGFFKHKNKITYIICFVAVAAAIALYDGIETNITLIISGAVGAFIFLLLPKNIFKNIEKRTDSNENISVYVKNAIEVIETQSNNFAKAFRSLAEAFEPEKELSTETYRKKNDAIIDDAAEKVCKDCTMSIYCWNVKSCETLSGFYYLIGQYDKTGSINIENMTEGFRLYCVKPKKLCEAISDSCRFLRNNVMWSGRLIKSRNIISEQLYSVANIIESMAKNVSFEDLKSPVLTAEMTNRLTLAGVNVENVYIFKEASGRTIINIKREICPFDNNDCTQVIIPIAEAVCKMTFVKSSIDCGNGSKNCTITLRQADRFGFKYSVSAEKRFDSALSGDSYMVEENDSGVLTVAISDGMGSGKAAKEESSKAMKLLSRFSSSGFDAGVSAGILNTVLLGSGDGELFTTLDVCCINMYTGTGKMIKNGGSTAFIIRDTRVTAIRSTSLPIGIIGGIDSDITEFSLSGGDMLLMITDGIADAVGEQNDERFIENIIKNGRKDISEISKIVVEKAKSIQNGKCKDDMLAVCVKIFEKR